MKFKALLLICGLFILTGCTQAEIDLAQKQLLDKQQEINLEQLKEELNKQDKKQDSPKDEEIIENPDEYEEFFDDGEFEGEFFDDEFDFSEMTADDCVEGEEYDPIEKVCYYECETDQECAAIEAKINAQLDAIGQDFFDGEKEYNDEHPTEESTLISYKVSNTSISNPTKSSVSDPNSITAQNATDKHNQIWQEFLKIAPADFINSYISTYEVFTDGKEGTLAYVTQDLNDGTKWVIGMDIQDAYKDGKLYTEDLHYSLIHEFAHILTLNNSQVNFDATLFNIMNTSSDDNEVENKMKAAESNCSTYFVPEGCTKSNSYFNTFFQNFWKSIFPEFKKIQEIESDEEYSTEADKFYNKYKNNFVSDYAATNPGEDIAESFTYFVLKEKPTTNTIANQKVNFFYNYQSLVELRNQIRRNLATQ